MSPASKHWLVAILWMGMIFAVSTDLGSGAHTSRFLVPLLRWLNPGISPEALGRAQFVVRKCAHLSEYAILALLLLRALRTSRHVPVHQWDWSAAGLALVLAAAYAATDEFHQMFVPSRGASIGDVLIDSTGALIGLGLIFLWQRRK